MVVVIVVEGCELVAWMREGWEVGGGRWEVGGGRWEVGDGRWEVGGGRWEVGGGRWEVGGDTVEGTCLHSGGLFAELLAN